MAKPRAMIWLVAISMRQPVWTLFARQPAGVSVSASALTYLGLPSCIARPLRWQRSSAARAEMNGGCQRGTKLYLGSSVERQEKRVLTIQSSGGACGELGDAKAIS